MKYCRTIKGLLEALEQGQQACACLKYDEIRYSYIYGIELVLTETYSKYITNEVYEQIKPYLVPRKPMKEVWVVAIIDNFSGSPHYGRKTYARKAIVKSGKIETSAWYDYAKHFESRDAAVKYIKNTLKGTVDNEYGYTLYRVEKVLLPK